MSSLPQGWLKLFDNARQHHYYYNEATRESQWETPTSIAPITPANLPMHCTPSAARCRPEGHDSDHLDANRVHNVDYIALARTYKLEQPYRDLNAEPMCSMCQSEPCKDVIFPCEHKCICRTCMRKNGIGESGKPCNWSFCPLCCGVIKRLLPHDGRERQLYWDWVCEIRPRLPPGFEERFEFAGAYLRQAPDQPRHTPRCSSMACAVC